MFSKVSIRAKLTAVIALFLVAMAAMGSARPSADAGHQRQRN